MAKKSTKDKIKCTKITLVLLLNYIIIHSIIKVNSDALRDGTNIIIDDVFSGASYLFIFPLFIDIVNYI